MVFYGREQSTWNLGQYRGKDVVGIRRMRMSYFPCYDPMSRGQLKSQRHGKLLIHHFAATQATIGAVFRVVVSANQLSLCGAVANMCEEYESHHDRSGQLDKVMGQSIVLSEIKTEVPLENDDPANQNFLLQQYEERIEKLSEQDKISKFCMGFVSVVEIGQYFMTKDTQKQVCAVTCREYTRPREDGSSQPREWIQGNTKLDPCWQLRPVACMVNTELKLEFGL